MPSLVPPFLSLFGGGPRSGEVDGVDDVEHERKRPRGVDAVGLWKERKGCNETLFEEERSKTPWRGFI